MALNRSILQLLAVQMDDDAYLEMLVATENGISIIDDLDSPATVLWQSEGEVQSVALYTPLSGDPLLAIIESTGAYSDSARLLVLELGGETSEVFDIGLASTANEIVFANTDGDSAMELVLNNGLIYDTQSWQNDWFYGNGFGDHLTAGDLDGDGVSEIVGADERGDVNVYSSVSKSLVYSLDNVNTCALNIGQVDDDSDNELLLGDCRQSYITAYNWDGSILEKQWAVETQDYGSKSILVGNSDEDANIEVHWGSRGTFVVLDVDDITTPQWLSDNSAQLAGFVGLDWGSDTLIDDVGGDETAVYLAASSGSGYGGQRLVYMDEDGRYEVSDEVSDNNGSYYYGRVADYDNDGMSELFVSLAESSYSGGASVW